MADLDIELTVTRDELALADLTVSRANGYSIVKEGIGPGRSTWRRITTTSPWVHGNQLVHAVREAPSMQVAVRVTGTSHSNLWTRINTLTDAFSQFDYDLTFTIEGVTFTWDRCQPADFSVGNDGQIDDRMIRSLKQEVRFLVERRKP